MGIWLLSLLSGGAVASYVELPANDGFTLEVSGRGVRIPAPDREEVTSDEPYRSEAPRVRLHKVAPSLRLAGERFVVVPPEHPIVPLRATALEEATVRVRRVRVEDHEAWVRAGSYEGGPVPGDPLFEGPLELSEGAIDLSAWVSGPDHFVVEVTAVDPVYPSAPLHQQARWVQVTDLRLVVAHDEDDGVAWVTDVATGVPRAGVVVGFVTDEGGDWIEAGRTDDSGLARFPLRSGRPGARWLVARTERGDRTFVPGPGGQAFQRTSTLRTICSLARGRWGLSHAGVRPDGGWPRAGSGVGGPIHPCLEPAQWFRRPLGGEGRTHDGPGRGPAAAASGRVL